MGFRKMWSQLGSRKFLNRRVRDTWRLLSCHGGAASKVFGRGKAGHFGLPCAHYGRSLLTTISSVLSVALHSKLPVVTQKYYKVSRPVSIPSTNCVTPLPLFALLFRLLFNPLWFRDA